MPAPEMSSMADVLEPRRDSSRALAGIEAPPTPTRRGLSIAGRGVWAGEKGVIVNFRVRESVGKQSAEERQLLSNNRGFLERIRQLCSGISGFLGQASLATMRPSFGKTCRSSLIAGLVTTMLQGLQMIVCCGRLFPTNPLRDDPRGGVGDRT